MTSSTETPRLAVVGCGYWGKNLVRNFHALGALQRVCDLTPQGRAQAATLAPGIDVTDSLEAALATDIDAVVIATPAETHVELGRRAIAAGKDVFVEKPLALRYQDGRTLCDEAQARKRILMVGHVLEYHPAVRAIAGLIASGALGKLQYLYSNRLNLGKIRREENILWSFAPHDIAILLRLVGATPVSVTSVGGAYVQPNIADVTNTNLLFADGVRAHIFVSWLHPVKEQRLVVVGAQKMVTFDDVNKTLLLYDQRVELSFGQEPLPIKAPPQGIAFDPAEPLRLECEAFLTAVRTRTPPLTDGRSGLDTLRVLQAAQQSLVSGGQPVSLEAV